MSFGLYLPSFPYKGLYDGQPEARIERVCESLMNKADRALMAGKATQAQYDAWTVALDRWASSVKTA